MKSRPESGSEPNPESRRASTTVTRHLRHRHDELWEQLTGDEGFEKWMGAGSTIEAEPGGRLIAADPESGEPKIGRVLQAEPGRSLRWVWRPLGEESVTEVLVVLEPEPTDPPGTVITVTESPSTLGVATATAMATATATC